MHWVMSVEIYVIFARGFCTAFVSLGVLSDLSLVDFYTVVKFFRMDAGSGFVHRDKFSPRVLVCSFSFDVCPTISHLTFMLWEICRLSFV